MNLTNDLNGIYAFFASYNIPVESTDVIEYEVAPFCSFIYDAKENRKYLHYIDEKNGEEYEEDIDSFTPRGINGVMVTKEDIDTFISFISK